MVASAGFWDTLADGDDGSLDMDINGDATQTASVDEQKADRDAPPPPPTDAKNCASPAPSDRHTPKTPSKPARIVIYTAALTILVLEVDVALQKADVLSQEVGGWIQASTSTSITLRIPAEHFRNFLAWAREMGTVQAESIVGQDVTEEYFDMEIWMRNAMATRDRYAELLKKATTVEEILAIEAELGRITGEIESYKGRLRFLRAHSQYSTVTLTFQAKPESYQGKRRAILPFAWLRGYELRQLYQGAYYY